MARNFLKLFFLFLFLHGFNGTMAQEKKYSVIFSPALLSPYDVSLQTGLAVKLDRRFSLTGELAFPVVNIRSSGFDKFKTVRAAAEIKYKRRTTSGLYYAFQSGYLFRKMAEKRFRILFYKSTPF